MKKTNKTLNTTTLLGVLLLAAGTAGIGGAQAEADNNFCMDVVIEPFHMMPGYMGVDGACAVRDYEGGTLQEAFYPFTIEDHLFNCEVFGDEVNLPGVAVPVPSSVESQDVIAGTIGGYPFEARLLCASLTNWYQDSCTDPDDPTTAGREIGTCPKRGLPRRTKSA